MGVVLFGLQIAVGLVSLVCFILVLMKMFQHGQTGLAIVCILLIWCVGPLIVLINGWMKAGEWKITGLMSTYTATVILGVLLSIAGQTISH
jgi:hypothetical protein